LLENFINAINI